MRRQTHIGRRQIGLALSVSLAGACVSTTEDKREITADSPLANLRDKTTRALNTCQTMQKLVVSGTLMGHRGSIGFEAVSQQKPASFSADFLSPLGNTLAVLETLEQNGTDDATQQSQIRCSGNCAQSIGIPDLLQSIAAEDYRNLICGSPAAASLVEQKTSWTQWSLHSVLEWQGQSKIAGRSAPTKVTVTEVGSCAEPTAPASSAKLLRIRTELSFGWIFKERMVIDWRGCLNENRESNKLALEPSSLSIWNESKAAHQIDLSIRFHNVEREP